MATFSHLPAELVEFVCGYLSQAQLAAISQVNKGLHHVAMPFLYRHCNLMIPPGKKVPRIDRFCMNTMKDNRLAARVETFCIGTSPFDGVNKGQRWLPTDAHFDNSLMAEMAIQAIENESLVTRSDYLIDAITLREYAAYAALILLTLPHLQRLHLADLECASIDYVHTILRNLESGTEWNKRTPSDALMARLASIKMASINVDSLNGVVAPSASSRINLDPVLNLPGLEELEFAIPQAAHHNGNAFLFGLNAGHLVKKATPTLITKLVIRHSISAPAGWQNLLSRTPALRSFTYDFFCDYQELGESEPQTVNLSLWTDILPKTLRTLAFSIEYCDRSKYPFQQPSIGGKLYGFLDLTNHMELHTLETPLPFLTGDADFSLSTEIYPLLPPKLEHLSLRVDLSHAQYAFPLDTSILPNGLSFHECEDEVRCSTHARMDVSYMFHASMAIFNFAAGLKTFSVWQPADPSLSWFEGQIEEFKEACRSRAVTGQIVYPMLLRWKNCRNWDLVKEVTVYDPEKAVGTLFHRGERNGIPLGLAAQYHLHALSKGQVRLRSNKV